MKFNKEQLRTPIITAVIGLIVVIALSFAISSNRNHSSKKDVSGTGVADTETDNEDTGNIIIENGSHQVVGGQENDTEEPEPEMFVTRADTYMNVRKEPDMEAEVVGKLYLGSGGIVLEKGEEWTLIESGNVTGYVYNDLVLFGEDAEEYAWQVADIIATSTANYLRIRKGAGTKYGIVCFFHEGKEAQVIEWGEEWSKVSYGNYTGYCSNEYLEFEYRLSTAMTAEEEEIWLAEEAKKKAAAEAAAMKKAKKDAAKLASNIAKCNFAETVANSPYDVTEEDAYLLACLVHAEARGEIYEGRLAVANIVLNRLRGGYYGDTIADVVYANNQFSVVKSGSLERALKNGPTAACVVAVKDALSGINNVPRFTNFCTVAIAKFERYAEYEIIDHQVYYRRK